MLGFGLGWRERFLAVVVACGGASGVSTVVVPHARAAEAGPPVNLLLPGVAGEPVVGQVLSAGSGSWSGAGPIDFQYQWQDCDAAGAGCAAIAGAAAATYRLSGSDLGHTVRVQVVATNAAGEAASLSPASDVVSATWPAGATRLAGGVVSIPVTSVVLPDQLVISSVQSQPAVVRSRQPFLVRFRVTDSHGYVVRGALVYALAVPSGLVQPAAETKTGTDGWASASFQPTPKLPLAKGGSLSVFVRARKAGEDLLSGVSTRRLVSITLGPPEFAAAGPNPYPARGRGVDVSWPNCDHPRPPAAAFAIIGVNDGHPFSSNPCLGREHSWYPTSNPSGFYLSTAYTSAYSRNITAACKQQTQPLQLPPTQAQAYAIGCSEAADSLDRLSRLQLPLPTVFWLDVETGKRWSTNQQLNVQTLRGMIAGLDTRALQTQIGIYSFPPMWRQITGGWATTLPEWIPRAEGQNPCHNPFSTGPVWLAQGGTSTLDTDTTC